MLVGRFPTVEFGALAISTTTLSLLPVPERLQEPLARLNIVSARTCGLRVTEKARAGSTSSACPNMRSASAAIRLKGTPVYGMDDRKIGIRVIVVRGGQWADGRGRLTGGGGAGNWTTSAGQCAGQWTAVRRG